MPVRTGTWAARPRSAPVRGYIASWLGPRGPAAGFASAVFIRPRLTPRPISISRRGRHRPGGADLYRLCLDRRLTGRGRTPRILPGPDPAGWFRVVPDLADCLGTRWLSCSRARRDDRHDRTPDPERAQPLFGIRVARDLAVPLPVSVLAALMRSAIITGLIRARSTPAFAPPGHDYPRRPHTCRFQKQEEAARTANTSYPPLPPVRDNAARPVLVVGWITGHEHRPAVSYGFGRRNGH